MCFGLESSPRLKYKLSKVNYSPTPWGLVSHLSPCKSPRMPHVSPGWEFPVTSALVHLVQLVYSIAKLNIDRSLGALWDLSMLEKAKKKSFAVFRYIISIS